VQVVKPASVTPTSQPIERKRTAADFTWSPPKKIDVEPPKQETKQPVTPKKVQDFIGECKAWLEESRNRNIALKPPPGPIGSYVEAFITEAVARGEVDMARRYINSVRIGLDEDTFHFVQSRISLR
jgi:hypothetical protein